MIPDVQKSLGISKFKSVARKAARTSANKPMPLTCPGQSQLFISLHVRGSRMGIMHCYWLTLPTTKGSRGESRSNSKSHSGAV